MNLSPYFSYIVIGLGVIVFLLVMYLINRFFLRDREAHWQQRLNGLDPEHSNILESEDFLPAKKKEGMFSRMDNAFETMIGRTGLDVTGEEALAFMSLTAVVFGGAMFLWRGQLWLTVLGFALGLLIPLVVFLSLQSRYQRKLQAQLADIYFLLARSLRAGLTLEQAIQGASEQNLEPISNEFKRCSLQCQMGLTIPAALRSTAKRINLLDFDAFVSTVSYHHSIGGNLPLQLDRLASSTRDRNEFRGHLSAATAQARATALFIGLAGPLLLLGYAIFQPTYVQSFFQSSAGWLLLLGCFVVELVAAVFLYQILKVDY